MKNQIWYTALECFDADSPYEFSWEKYKAWSKLTHLSELVSLDGLLHDLIFEPDYNSMEDWEFIITEGEWITPFFNSLEYVLEKTKDIPYFNLLAVRKSPNKTKLGISDVFEFVGYDLIEKDGNISALTNCGGFDESFLPSDLNEFGLISDWTLAKKIQADLIEHNPEEHHADCYLYEVWRHQSIGRKNKPL